LSVLPARDLVPTETARSAPTPVLRLDIAVVAARYAELRSALPDVALHYAVKANPDRDVLQVLAGLGCRFDVASPGEVAAVLAAGADPAQVAYGNTVKRAADVASAYDAGVRLFTLDSPLELDKLVALAPGATLVVRIATSGRGADWALGTKFGCPEQLAATLLDRAVESGHPVGVGFHVGSQQRDVHAWDAPLAATARLREHLRTRGHDLAVVDIGGGFPASMLEPTPPIAAYGDAIRGALDRHLGPVRPHLVAEPGRFLVADAGVLDSEVVLVADRTDARWVYLDVGVFTGMVETLDEAVRYRIEALRDDEPLSGPTGETVLAGPTCDSVDVLYRRHRYLLPLALRPGDRVRFHAAGAYTSACSTVGFNGFAPLRQVVA
jgi:ornithine decarboxylase